MIRSPHGNPTVRHGVRHNMRRAFLCLLWSVAAVAQTPPREPLDLAFEAYWKARGEGRFEEAVAKREEAAALLDRAPVDDARFGSWAASVSQLYQNAGMTVRARTIMEAALARANRLGESHSSRITVLTSLADSWQQDGNLLKAVVYLEQAAAAAAAAGPQGNATPIPTAVVPTNRVVRTGFMVGVIGSSPGGLTPMIAGDRWFAPARFG